MVEARFMTRHRKEEKSGLSHRDAAQCSASVLRLIPGRLSRNDPVGMGSARASRAVCRALAGQNKVSLTVNHAVRVSALESTGEGAGRNTRRRVCSPKGTESFRLSQWICAVAFGGALLLTAAASAASEAQPLKLWYSQPAEKWTEALPVGNGHMGAMVFGGTANERIQFNEDTLWRGKPHDYVRKGALDALPEIRRLVFEGQAEAAGRLAREKAISNPVRQMPYQPFGDLHLQFPGHENATDYRRELDFDSAVASVSYTVGDVTFQRETFASYPDRVVVVHLSASKPGRIQFTLRMDSPHTNSQSRVLASNILVLAGAVQPEGLRFESRVRVESEGGKMEGVGDALKVDGADTATLFLVARTSFINFENIAGNPNPLCEQDLDRLKNKSFSELRAAHVVDHQKLFRRVSLDLGSNPVPDLPTNERLNRVKREGLAADAALAALHFQYGRYLLIASSRPGSQPANLQGVWNEELNPPWESKYTLNINCEMNYWPAEAGNLSECHEPLFDMIQDLTVSGARAAKEQYGCRGWVVHHNTDLWRGAAPINNVDGFWPSGGAWLSHHLWEHYLFTGDQEFLERRAYPAMRAASLFFVDFLVKEPKTGYLVTCPSHSPEQPPPDRPLFTPGPTMDNQLIRQLFTYTIEAAKILGTDEEFAQQLSNVRAQLPPNLIGSHGQLQEWLEDWDAPNNNHRHMSPLWGLYPGWDITPADPRIWQGAKVLLKWRGNGSTGWSFAWRMPLWARVGDGDFAYSQYQGLLQRRTLPNLFDLCGPYQIDGNFGACGGVIEMLLQSHLVKTNAQTAEVRILDLLPALPRAWSDGAVRGLCARGGFEVDLTWKNSALAQAVIRSKLGKDCCLRYGKITRDLELAAGDEFTWDLE